MPISAGSTPTLAKARIRARIGSPSSNALASLIIITAAAPSLMLEALPAVTDPRRSKVGCRLASPSALASTRGCSSVSTVRAAPLCSVTTGTISSRKRPESIALRALCCELSARASCSSRLMPNSGPVFRRDAHMIIVESIPQPIMHQTVNQLAVAQLGAGAAVGKHMRSAAHILRPPAITTSASPHWIARVARCRAFRPEPQTSLMVIADTVLGSPPRIAD